MLSGGISNIRTPLFVIFAHVLEDHPSGLGVGECALRAARRGATRDEEQGVPVTGDAESLDDGCRERSLETPSDHGCRAHRGALPLGLDVTRSNPTTHIRGLAAHEPAPLMTSQSVPNPIWANRPAYS